MGASVARLHAPRGKPSKFRITLSGITSVEVPVANDLSQICVMPKCVSFVDNHHERSEAPLWTFQIHFQRKEHSAPFIIAEVRHAANL